MSDTPDDFRDLVRRAGQGDAAALQQLTEQYESKIRIVAKVRLGPALRPFLDASDVVHSVHRAILLGLRQGDFDFSSPERLTGLAVKMVYRRIAQHWRREKRKKRLNGEADGSGNSVDAFVKLAGNEPDPARALEARELVERVLAKLDPDDRTLLEMWLDGYRRREIAERLNIQGGAFRMRWMRLRKQLEADSLFTDWMPLFRADDVSSTAPPD